ncbi:MAG: HAD family hydrolase, partial [Patescibacteria group bacterium]
CDENAIEVLRIAKDRGLLKGTCLLSNVQVPWPPLIKRVSFIAKKIRTPHYHAACFPYAKPHPRAVQTALSMMGASAEQTVMIGDQLNKDIRAANAAGIYSILRFPSYGSDPWYRTGKRKKQNAAIEQWLSQQRR